VALLFENLTASRSAPEFPRLKIAPDKLFLLSPQIAIATPISNKRPAEIPKLLTGPGAG
jgi:hypothetical protein